MTVRLAVLLTILGGLLGAMLGAQERQPVFEPCIYGVMLVYDSLYIEWTPEPCLDGFMIDEESHYHSTTLHRDCMRVYRLPGIDRPVVDTLPWWCDRV